jgi:energy-coupling factor transport system substrate-specific component
VSWPLAAYGLLAVSLLAGFAWYERTRPDARIVALVGTLAAFGALGRIAFAAVPNVKPTTDIVLISGYALGGAPGFVVGAVSALTSNFFFGQGPWTPWQMAGWGMIGILGAGLARITGGHIGRWPLAAIAFPAGFAFTALQDVGDWVTYSDHSLAQLGVYVGKGVGFDLVHATGCVAFALAFGPAMIRSLGRFRLRLQVVWSTAPLLLAAVVALHIAAQPGGAQAAGPAAGPVAYLLSAQNADGGYGPAARQTSNPLETGWAALGLAAAGIDPAGVRHGGASLLSYVQDHQAEDPGSLERTILVLTAAGVSPGETLARLRHDIRPDGSVSEQTNLTAFALLALRAANAIVPPRTIAWLAHQQDADGGFNYAEGGHGGTSDVDDTGAGLEALAGTGHAAEMSRAAGFIEKQEDRDGGFPSQAGSGSNAQSTAFAVQGLIAAGAAVTRPEAYLRSLVTANGSVDYARGQSQTPVWVTAEAELALAGKPLPLAPLHTAAAGPVARRPPVRKSAHRAPVARRGRRAARSPRHQAPGLSRSRSTAAIDALASDAGAAAAILLAPLDV